MEYPVGISYFAFAAAKVTLVLAGSPDIEARQQVSASSLFGTPDVQHEIRLFLVLHALGVRRARAPVRVAAGRCQSAAAHGTRPPSRCRPRWR